MSDIQRWYLSFADENQWHGACVVFGDSIEDAAATAWDLGCNPGGQVFGFPIVKFEIPEEFMGVLLTVEDVCSLDLLGGGEGVAVNVAGKEKHRVPQP